MRPREGKSEEARDGRGGRKSWATDRAEDGCWHAPMPLQTNALQMIATGGDDDGCGDCDLYLICISRTHSGNVCCEFSLFDLNILAILAIKEIFAIFFQSG